MNNSIESALADAGFSVSDSIPTQAEESNTPPQDLSAPPQDLSAPPQEPTQQSEPATQGQDYQAPSNNEQQPDDINVEAEVLRYLSERLGTEISDYDYLSQVVSNKPVEIDERVAAINEFVKNTGRSPEDWYKYQQLNPSEMDDLTAVRNQLVVEHGNLSPEEIGMLLEDRYRLDENQYDENEINMSKLRLKMDAEKARNVISSLRDSYMLPQQESQEGQSPIDESWIQSMTAEVNDFDGLVFELPSGGQFTYGIKDDYRNTLINKNKNLDSYFNEYVNDNGSWNFEKLNAHRAVVDNIDSIVKSVYQQGLSDGQRKVVQNAANISNQSPQRDSNYQSNSLDEQIIKAFGGGNTLTFNI